jgi:hypothetical protein
LFLDDCFSSDSAVKKLEPHFKLEVFHKWFRDENQKKQNGIKDPKVITFCHNKGWLLVTADHEMRKTHVEEIKAHPRVTILATARNCASAQELHQWLDAIIKLKPTILRDFKKKPRPWFATFNIEGHITSFKTITEADTTRRTRAK